MRHPASMFTINLVLMLAWCGSFASFDPWTLLTGFLAGFAGLYLTRGLWAGGEPSYFRKTFAFLRFAAFYLRALIESSIQIARLSLSRRIDARPVVIAVPLAAERDVEIAALANLITLTPGTLSLDVSDDRSTLYVHAIVFDHPDAVLRDIKLNFERRLLEVLR
jgi:multicomponent Na+:H+ antiporter subunit E